MFNESHKYDLAFVSPARRPRTLPELVFIIRGSNLEELNSRLVKVAHNLSRDFELYCGEPARFFLPEPDLFGRTEFGIDRCGYLTQEDDEFYLRIPLTGGKRVLEATMTIHVLLWALGTPFEGGVPTNRPQLVDVITTCDRFRSGGWGHAVGGHISSTLIDWVAAYAAKHSNAADASGRQSPVKGPPEVIKAMRETWYATADKDGQQWAKDCDAIACHDGRFGLTCFGNACDLSIYPDQFSAEMLQHFGSVEFGCHNLDTAEQQLTLLAGLAKLCELAREGS